MATSKNWAIADNRRGGSDQPDNTRNIDRAAANTTARPVSPPAWACTTANVIMAVVEDGPTATVRVEVSRATATAAPTTVYRPAARAYGMRVAAAVSPAKASPRN